jgi:hypothetical protein
MFTHPLPNHFNPILSYKDENIVVIDNFYQPFESENCIDKINNMPFTSYYNMKHRGYCNDSSLADIILSTVAHLININGWTPSSVNPNFRFIKGDKGYYMSSHFDESKLISINRKSFYSVLLYLNDDIAGDILFNDKNIQFKPKAGRLIVFNQKLRHQSEPSNNQKYFIHSEIIFDRINHIINQNDHNAFDIFKAAQELPYEQKNIQEDIAFNISIELENMVLNI